MEELSIREIQFCWHSLKFMGLNFITSKQQQQKKGGSCMLGENIIKPAHLSRDLFKLSN